MARKTKGADKRKTAKIIKDANKMRASFFADQEATIIAKFEKSGASDDVIQKMRSFIAQGAAITDDGW